MRIAVFIFLVLALLPGVVNAQSPNYRQFTVEEGLLSDIIYDVFEDKNGLLWVATQNGLQSYNGNDFRTIQTEFGSVEVVHNLITDQNDQIWCISFTGKVFYIENNVLIPFYEEKSNQSRFIFLHKLSGSKLAITNQNQLLWIDPLKKKLDTCKLKIAQEYQFTEDSVIPKMDRLWSFNGEVYTYNYLKGYGKIENDVYYPIQEEHRGKYHEFFSNAPNFSLERTGGENYAIRRTAHKGHFANLGDQFYDFGSNRLYFLTQSNGHLFVSTENGLYFFQDENNPSRTTQWFGNMKLSRVIQTGNVVWAGTQGNGLLMIPNVYAETITLKDFTKKVTSLEIVNSSLIALSKDGSQYDISNAKRSDQLTLTAGRTIDWEALPVGTQIRGALISLLPSEILDLSGKIGGGLLCASKLNKSEWLLSANSGVYSVSTLKSEKIKKFSSARCHSNVVLSEDEFYFSDVNGLHFFNKGKVRSITANGKAIFAIRLLRGLDNDIYATRANELLQFRNGELISSFELSKDRNMTINQIRLENQELVISSTRGLLVFDLIAKSLKRYGKADGLLRSNVTSALVFEDDYVILNGQKIIRISRKSSPLPAKPPVLEIIQIVADGISMKSKNGDQIPNGTKILEFFLQTNSASDFAEGGFKYRLNKGDWREQKSSENVIRLNNLNPGNYTLTLIPLSSTGDEGVPITRTFELKSHFYQRTSFYVLITCFFFVVAIIAIYSIQRKRKQRQEILLKLKASELKAVKSQMNPHFIFNALNSIQQLILEEDFRKSNKYLSAFSSLVRHILEWSEKEEIQLSKVLEMLKQYTALEELRFGDDITCEYYISLSNNELEESYVPPLLVQPFVENAFKHGLLHKDGKKELFISFDRDNRDILITIEDNGIGRKKSAEINQRNAKKNESFGERSVYSRIDLINTQIKGEIRLSTIDLPNGGGTRIELCIPDDFRMNTSGIDKK